MLRKVSEMEGDYLAGLKGAKVYGLEDEKLGTVDDALIDDRSGELRYLLISAGWLSSRKFIVPAEQVYAFRESDDFYVNLRQVDVEGLPEFRDADLASNEAFAAYESGYRRLWRYDMAPTQFRASSHLLRFRERLHNALGSERIAKRGVLAEPATYVSPGTPRPTGVYGVYTDREQVERAVDRLRSGGFHSNDVSVVFPDSNLNKEFALEKNTKAPEGALAGGGTGLLVGGTLGWLAGIGTLAIPGIGPLIAAGPIIAALAGAGVGSAIGGIAGGLVGLGLPEIEAKRYEEEIKRGRILVSVHCDSMQMAQTARKVLEDSGAKDVFLSGEQLAA